MGAVAPRRRILSIQSLHQRRTTATCFNPTCFLQARIEATSTALAKAGGPLQQRRDIARLKREERPTKQFKGIEHQVSNPKQLREVAKRMDKQIAKAQADWDRGRSQMSNYDWRALLEARDAAWGEALPNPHHP